MLYREASPRKLDDLRVGTSDTSIEQVSVILLHYSTKIPLSTDLLAPTQPLALFTK